MIGGARRFGVVYGYLAGRKDGGYVLAADYDTALAERDRARATAARLEGELARVRAYVINTRITLASLESGDEDLATRLVAAGMLKAFDTMAGDLGFEPDPEGDPTPWPHPDAEVAS